MNYLINFLFIFIITVTNVSYAITEDNKIIFKLNNKVFTEIDLKKRIEYIKISNDLGSNKISNLEKEEILNDYISSVVFYEYFIKERIFYKDINSNIDTMFNKNILNKNNNLKLDNQDINDLKYNFKIDIIRKKIIENFLNSQEDKLKEENEILDLIYNYNLSYLTFKEQDIKKINLNNIKNREDFNKLKIKLSKNNVKFLFKNDNLKESSIKTNLQKKIINKNIKIYFEKKNNFIFLTSVEKNLVSYEGIYVKLINFNTDKPIEKKNLNCQYIKKITDSKKTIFKEYEYKMLNDQIKNNLKSIGDYIIYKNKNIYNYIFLCELRYDETILKNINFNKKIDLLANKIQKKFINKYKNEYDYQRIK